MTNEKAGNRLINEKSPYLLQHAHNPVDCFPLGRLCLRGGQKREKPVFLSIGYSSCHWRQFHKNILNKKDKQRAITV